MVLASRSSNKLSMTSIPPWKAMSIVKLRALVGECHPINPQANYDLALKDAPEPQEEAALSAVSGTLRRFNEVFSDTYQLTIGRVAEGPVILELRSQFSDWLPFPVNDARKIYNLSCCCKLGLTLDLFPDSSSILMVTGVSVYLRMATIQADDLYTALVETRSARDLAFDLLANDQGDDYWAMHTDP